MFFALLLTAHALQLDCKTATHRPVRQAYHLTAEVHGDRLRNLQLQVSRKGTTLTVSARDVPQYPGENLRVYYNLPPEALSHCFYRLEIERFWMGNWACLPGENSSFPAEIAESCAGSDWRTLDVMCDLS